MDQALIVRLESSFQLLAPRGAELVDCFYCRLFAEHPEVRPLFPEDMREQKKKLLTSLVLVINNLRTPEKLLAPLHQLGRNHVAYGTKPEHYPIVRDTLVAAMIDLAGPAWNSQLTCDWNSAIDLVSTIMLEGAVEK
ncbi:MAG: Bacterial hemoglobin [Phycisphaerae bacterium]|nr:Bacterial hemoglobin [Phycisphaerae bacterium]